MKIIFKSFPKKGQAGTDSAIIQLFYIVLGVFVLLTFVKVILTFLNLDAHTNSDISKSNAESIYNFQEYSSSDKFKNLDSCFTTLKLTNLETYQFQENDIGQNNIIIIDKSGVYTLKISKKEVFYENPSTDNLKKIKTFNPEINLVVDKTEQGLGFQIDLYLFKIGDFDSQLKLEDDIKFIVLEPIFGKSFTPSYDNVVSENTEFLDNRNKYLVKTIPKEIVKQKGGRGGIQTIIGGVRTLETETLAFNPKTNQLFVTNGKTSDSLINNELCSYKNFRNILDFEEFTKDNGKNIPTAYYDVLFTIDINRKDSGYKFTWADKIICEKDKLIIDCYQTLKIDQNTNIDYLTFIEKIQNFGKTNIEFEGNYNLKTNYEKLSVEEMNERAKNNIIPFPKFNQVFTKPKVILNTHEMSRYEKIENNVYELDDSINGCPISDCKDLYFTKGKHTPVFYVQGDSNNIVYRHFNTNYLVQNKKEDKLYYNGKEIKNYKQDDSDKYGISLFGGDNIDIFILHDIELYDETNKLKKYSVVISSTQKNFLREVQ
jgi:hypothetical protein